VRDLCRNENESEALLNAVTNQLAADSWSTAGGPGTIHFPLPGTMVVLQQESVHDKLLQLLDNYRSALRMSKARPRPGSDPKEVLTRYYRMPETVAKDFQEALPLLIQPETWRNDAKPEAVGTIMKLASRGQIDVPANVKPEAAGAVVSTPYAVLVIKQTRQVHEKIPELLFKIEVGEPPLGEGGFPQRPFVTSVVPVFGGGLGGGGFGGASPSAPAGGGFGGGLIGK